MDKNNNPADTPEPIPLDAVDNEDIFAEPKPIVLTGQEANDFAEMILTRKPRRSEVLACAFARHRKWDTSK